MDKTATPPANSGTQQTQTPETVTVEQSNEAVKQQQTADAALLAVVADMVSEIPENLRVLVPGQLTPIEKIRWITDARKTGVFTQLQPASGPDSRVPASGKPPANYEAMTPIELIKNGLKQKGVK